MDSFQNSVLLSAARHGAALVVCAKKPFFSVQFGIAAVFFNLMLNVHVCTIQSCNSHSTRVEGVYQLNESVASLVLLFVHFNSEQSAKKNQI